MLDLNDNAIEGTMSNIFGVKKNIFYTPNIKFAGIEGIMRGVILKLLKKNKEKYVIKEITLKELLKFDEVFVCNSIFGIWPVIKISKKKFSFGDKTKKILYLLSDIMPFGLP
jgi:4-amino-4-deoxychorismate lyase